ncbi:MAG: CHAD domain-containing protein [Leptolyngbya sp. SIO4C1]|nr:CHAD domain-containing protein [Leptolyngbya sp. SIO4C1]
MSASLKSQSRLLKRVLANPDCLGAYAHRTVQKHFKKAIKQKRRVLKDTDPEALHQMRVGLRRLRAAIELFDHAVDLPAPLRDRSLAKIARRLGGVRDLDVLLLWLQNFCQTTELSDAEQTALQRVEADIHQQRQKRFRRMRRELKRDRYADWVEATQQWLAEPRYRLPALIPIELVAPDLLLPLVGEMLQHPGWLVGTAQTQPLRPLKRMSLQQINRCLAAQSDLLHDLRKRMKHLRYQSEFFIDLYTPAYAALVKDFRQLQDTLGSLQDEAVISDCLAQTLGSTWAEQVPSLAQFFTQERRQLWKAWQAMQAQYLDPAFRQQLRQAMLRSREAMSA